jgi:uncharacterized alpha-E superfamily protein
VILGAIAMDRATDELVKAFGVDGVANFLLQNPSFPRSVLLCASEAARLLGEL